jgi:hypothetical protein
LSIYLYPAFITLVFPGGQNLSSINSFTRYGLFLLVCAGAFLVKQMDYIIAYVALSGLSFLGFGGLIVILLVGLVKGIRGLTRG